MSQLLGLKTCPPPVPSLAAGQPGRSLCGLCACRVPRPRPACLPASEATLFRTAADAIRPSRGQKLRPLPAPRVSSVLCARSFGAFVGPGVPESRPTSRRKLLRPEAPEEVRPVPLGWALAWTDPRLSLGHRLVLEARGSAGPRSLGEPRRRGRCAANRQLCPGAEGRPAARLLVPGQEQPRRPVGKGQRS